MIRMLRMIWTVTRAFMFAGFLGGGLLGGLTPMLLLPPMLFFTLFGYEAEIGTLTLIAIFGAITGAVVGLVVGVLAGIASGIVTGIWFPQQIGSLPHRHVIRIISAVVAGVMMFLGVGVLFNSYDMSLQTVLIWRLPTGLIAAAYGWWLGGYLVNNGYVWDPTPPSVDIRLPEFP